MSSAIETGKPYKKRKHRVAHHEEAHEGEGPWIVSYADMMTLLFCFFVIMTSFANFDPVVVAGRSKIVADHFAKGETKDEFIAVKDLGSEVQGHPNLKGLVTSKVVDGTLEIVFQTSLMFPPGETDIQKDFIKNVDILVGLIKNRNPNYRIIVEGHTDKTPIPATCSFSADGYHF